MKKYTAIIFFLTLSFVYNTSLGQSHKLAASVGIPVIKINSKKISAEILGQKMIITDNFFIGIGYRYTDIDIAKTNHLLTYDKVINTGFLVLNYDYQFWKKIVLTPELQFGYSDIRYQLNEFDKEQQDLQSFSYSAVLSLGYKINSQISLNLEYSFNYFLNKLNTDIDFIIPAIYLSSNEKIGFRNIGFKIIYKYLK